MTTKTEDVLPRSSRPQMAFILACDKLKGGGQEAEVQRLALPFEGGTVPSSLHNHYSRAADQLAAKGLLRKVIMGRETQWWLTDKAWRALGHDGPAPGPEQAGLF